MVRRGESAVRDANRKVAAGEALEGRGRPVMHQVAVHIEQRLSIRAFQHLVPIPDLIEKRARTRIVQHASFPPLASLHRWERR